jgi:hypothetical protein
VRTLEQLKNVPVGEMSPEEQALVVRRACQLLAWNLEKNAREIRAILQATSAPCTCHAPGAVHALSCPQHPEHAA